MSPSFARNASANEFDGFKREPKRESESKNFQNMGMEFSRGLPATEKENKRDSIYL